MKSLTLLKLWQRNLAATSMSHLRQLSRLSSQSRIGPEKSRHQQQDAGFTLIELLIGMLMIGILSSIAAPGWLAFINNQGLRSSQGRVYGAMQLAQSNAKRDKVSWQASFRTVNGVVQVAVHPATENLNLNNLNVSNSGGNTFSENTWINLEQKVAIDTTNTTLITVDPATNKVQTGGGGSVYTAIFNRQGCFVDDTAKECTDATTVTGFNQKGMITLQHSQLGTSRKCAIIGTLLGAMRTGDDATNCNKISY